MQPNEANELADRLSGMIPTMTDQQMLSVAEKLEKYPRSVGYKAVTSYVEANDQFSLPRFLMVVRTASSQSNDGARKPKEFRYLDVLRAGVRQIGGTEATLPDADFMLFIGRGWWARSFKNGGCRLKITRDVIQTLMRESVMDEGQAAYIAEQCFVEEVVPEM